MAKRRKSRRSGKCPEPFNFLIDLAAAATMGAIADKRRKKKGYKKSRIDPYAATGFAMGTGKINNTEDLIRLGGFLGAMGAFDDDVEEPTFSSLDNRYAWRLNCEDGEEYGVDPYDYETRADFNLALEEAKILDDNLDLFGADEHVYIDTEKSNNSSSNKANGIVRVSILKTGDNINCIACEEPVIIGERVLVEHENGQTQEAIVISILNVDADKGTIKDRINKLPRT